MAVQVALHLGARVIAATSPAKLDQARALGAEEEVNSREPFSQIVRDLTDGPRG